MSRVSSRSRKPTVKELGKQIQILETRTVELTNNCEVLAQMINAAFENMNSMAGIMISHLVQEGKMVATTCRGCGEKTHLPNGLDIEPTEECAFCHIPFADAEPCPKCGALLGWIDGCGEEGAFDYEPTQFLTECLCVGEEE